MNFNDWKTQFIDAAHTAGISDATLAAIAPLLRPTPAATQADTTQSETRKTLRQYLDITVTEARITAGRAALAQYADVFDQAETQFGVPRHIVAAIWGLESNYGQIRGNTPVFQALANLAHAGRRQALFEAELIAACKIVEQGVMQAPALLGSWAGAMGHVQFMPSSYVRYAMSTKGAGHVPDIWSDDPSDALISAAHYLQHHGWISGQPWGGQVQWPCGFDIYAARQAGAKPMADWVACGVGGGPDTSAALRFILPGGVQAPGFLVAANFDVLMAYNNAAPYAVAVGHLADRLSGHATAPLVTPNTVDSPALSLPQLQDLQRKLTQAGFDTQGADGFHGPNTERAIAAYQVQHGLPADGYPNQLLLDHISAG